MTFWYLATPYRAHPNGPIVHSHYVARLVRNADPSSDFWLKRQLPMMRAARGIIVAELPGWDASAGMRFERTFFCDAGKPERFVRAPFHPLVVHEA